LEAFGSEGQKMATVEDQQQQGAAKHEEFSFGCGDCGDLSPCGDQNALTLAETQQKVNISTDTSTEVMYHFNVEQLTYELTSKESPRNSNSLCMTVFELCLIAAPLLENIFHAQNHLHTTRFQV
jgi:hypothetical protein